MPPTPVPPTPATAAVESTAASTDEEPSFSELQLVLPGTIDSFDAEMLDALRRQTASLLGYAVDSQNYREIVLKLLPGSVVLIIRLPTRLSASELQRLKELLQPTVEVEPPTPSPTLTHYRLELGPDFFGRNLGAL